MRCTLLAWTEHQLSCDAVVVHNKGHQQRPRSGVEPDHEQRQRHCSLHTWLPGWFGGCNRRTQGMVHPPPLHKGVVLTMTVWKEIPVPRESFVSSCWQYRVGFSNITKVLSFSSENGILL